MIEGPGSNSLARRSRQDLCVLGREYLLIGHLQDRVGLPLATQIVGEAAQVQIEDLGHRALLAVCQQAAVQAHLLSRSLILNVTKRHGEDDARAIGRGLAVGAGLGRDGAMSAVLSAKFEDTGSKNGLLATGDACLLEHDSHHGLDDYWSDDRGGAGQNMLGQTLMATRADSGSQPSPSGSYTVSDFTQHVQTH